VAAYRDRIKTTAIKELDAIGQLSDRRRIARRIRDLARDSRPPGCQKLGGWIDRYLYR
jgi:hypothetical protein